MGICHRAVIPAAGVGSRLRPVTEAVPKEMFPIGRYPAIEWVLAEAVASGCTEIAVIVSPAKRVIEEYLAEGCAGSAGAWRLSFLMQEEPRGLGHALLLARGFSEGQPLAVLLPDDIYDAAPPPLVQMAAEFAALGGAMFALAEEAGEHAGRYGRLDLRPLRGPVYQVNGVGPRGPAPAQVLVGAGRYLLVPEVLEHAARLAGEPRCGELDDGAILARMIAAGSPVHGFHVQGPRFDVSTPEGYVAAWQRFGKEQPVWESR
ncbi:MAG: sugar phosphate nucleotidyltransferase [Armatimonadota bacterium]|nr:sugar phosphate nucleotidyltransferase [Armatimonadota bacterium]